MELEHLAGVTSKVNDKNDQPILHSHSSVY
jgi:hypothetical protein